MLIQRKSVEKSKTLIFFLLKVGNPSFPSPEELGWDYRHRGWERGNPGSLFQVTVSREKESLLQVASDLMCSLFVLANCALKGYFHEVNIFLSLTIY
jgi:hypothetical protein